MEVVTMAKEGIRLDDGKIRRLGKESGVAEA